MIKLSIPSPGGTLAHAFFPIYGGDVHFDDDENWTDNFQSGTNLLMTASHELGHSLGLAHSDVRGSVMSPFYTPFKNGLRLHKDDVRAIQALYGAGGDSNRSASSLQLLSHYRGEIQGSKTFHIMNIVSVLHILPICTRIVPRYKITDLLVRNMNTSSLFSALEHGR